MNNLGSRIHSACKVGNALLSAGWSAGEMDRLANSQQLEGYRRVLHGQALIAPSEEWVDLDSPPFIPETHLKVEEHREGGLFRWDMSRVARYYAPHQEKYGVRAKQLRESLEGKPVCNANLLDHGLRYPHLIPIWWNHLMFWGTIYSSAGGTQHHVRYAHTYDGKTWTSKLYPFDYAFNECTPAAIVT